MPFLHRDGIALHYERMGGDGRPAILLHGWCCDPGFVAPQADFLAAKGYSVLVPDLRGHGLSDKPSGPYAIADFADDIAFLSEALGLAPAVLVGHSMGGIIAYEAARRHPAIAAGIVMLDSAVAPADEVKATMWQTVARLQGPDHAAVLRDIIGRVFFIASDDPERRARILDIMASAPQHVMVGAYAGLADYDPGAAGVVGVPALYVAADEPTPRTDNGKMRVLLPQLLYGQTVGSGHFCQLEVPDQINAMIARFLAVSGLDP